jgi:hypothetical protein
LNQQRAEDLAAIGHRFRGILEVAACWHIETFRFLKGGSRVIALADYRMGSCTLPKCFGCFLFFLEANWKPALGLYP